MKLNLFSKNKLDKTEPIKNKDIELDDKALDSVSGGLYIIDSDNPDNRRMKNGKLNIWT